VRVFYITNPEEFYDIEIGCVKHYWDMWVSRIGCNDFSDGSGIFAISKVREKELGIYSWKLRQRLFVF
jgi:hypothetical protein